MANAGLLILPAAVIEGPVVSIIAGWLCQRGQLGWFQGIALLVCGDLLGDLVYYWIGRSGSAPIARFIRWLGLPSRLPVDLAGALRANTARMLVLGKWTQSMGAIMLIGAGAMRLNLAKFLLVNLMATIPKSLVLFGVGYFAWPYYLLLSQYPLAVSLFLLVIGAAPVVLVIRIRRDAFAGAVER
jgi:membrane protein DedA with SNARE-associated domain